VGDDEGVTLEVLLGTDSLKIELDAPFHGDAPPDSPRGSCPELWEYEVVELFLLGADERYVEVELGPHGHFLVLTLHGIRKRVADGHPLEYHCQRSAGRWRATAVLDASLLPDGLERYNAYAIHGSGHQRRYLAAHSVGGDVPDFHRLERFEALNWNEAGA